LVNIMPQNISHHSWVEVSGSALIHNLKQYRRALKPGVSLLVVVKSNAYGHGLTLASQVAAQSGLVDWLGTASLSEALTLRSVGFKLPILVLSYYHPLQVDELIRGIKTNISFVVYETQAIKQLAVAARKARQRAKVHLKINTGMARLGIDYREASQYLRLIKGDKNLLLEGVASHFATAESKFTGFLQTQLENFDKFLVENSSLLGSKIYKHIACSAAINTQTGSQYNLVRLGIGYYGLWPSFDNKTMVKKTQPYFKLQPALTWKTNIIELQKLAAGVTVGYGRSYLTKRPLTMAVLPIGYWDGYDRKLSNHAQVLVQGKLCSIIGRVCMNITMVDVSHVKNVKVGDEVVLLGRQGRGVVAAEYLAEKSATINYEVVTRINPNLPRALVG